MRVDTIGIPVAEVGEAIKSAGFTAFPAVQEMSALSGLVGTTVTAHATAHTVGSWTELITATTIAASWLLISINDMAQGSQDTRGLLDIGFGAGGSEVAMISSVPAGFASISVIGSPMVLTAAIPIDVPIGTRISARLQSLVTVDTANVVVATARGQRGGTRAPSTVDTIGADTANSRGTNMPTTNTYVQLTAATAQAYRGLVMVPCGGTGTAYSSATVTYTLAIGASGSEVAIGTGSVRTGTSETLSTAFGMPIIVAGHYPKGTRIACKQSTGVTYRDVIVFGLPYT